MHVIQTGRHLAVFLAAIALSLPVQAGATDYYVDALTGHDSYAGTSQRPRKTIQAAINAASSGDRIYVAPGVYAPIVVDRRLTIIGTKGSAKTFIDGSGKYRCAKFDDVVGYELHGFTLQNGYSGKDHGAGAYNGILRRCVIKNCRTFTADHQYGGGGAYLSHLYDCIVERCSAGFGGAMNEGRAYRCTFRYNYASDRGGALWKETQESVP